jgi:hypothetical protein
MLPVLCTYELLSVVYGCNNAATTGFEVSYLISLRFVDRIRAPSHQEALNLAMQVLNGIVFAVNLQAEILRVVVRQFRWFDSASQGFLRSMASFTSSASRQMRRDWFLSVRITHRLTWNFLPPFFFFLSVSNALTDMRSPERNESFSRV